MRRFLVLYRPGDADRAATAIHRELCQRFGSWRVRLAGDDEQIMRAGCTPQQLRGQCAALVVVMGQRWTSDPDPRGFRRIDNPFDLQRQMLECALRIPRILVLPVLVDNAAMPRPFELPPSLADLAYRNAAVTPAGQAFPHAVQRIVRGIRTSLPYQERISYPQYAVPSGLLYLMFSVAFYASLSAIGGFANYKTLMTGNPSDPAVVRAYFFILTPICLIDVAGVVLSVIALVRAVRVRSWPWAIGIIAGMLFGPLMPLLFGVFGRAEPPPRPSFVSYYTPAPLGPKGR